MYDICWELLCHFHIFLDSQNKKKRSKGVSNISWAAYLFPNVKGSGFVKCLSPMTEHEIEKDFLEQDRTWTSEGLEGEFKSDATF